MAIDVYNCLSPTMPKTESLLSTNFGIPKGSAGRRGQTIKGIVIQCVPQALQEFNANICRDWRLGQSGIPDIVSVHYAVGNKGNITNYVCDANIAWGFTPQLGNFPSVGSCTFDWALATANPNINPDEYVLHIALEAPPEITQTTIVGNTGCDNCDGKPTVLSNEGLNSLVHLIAGLAFKYNIAVNTDFIQFAQNITPCSKDQCKCNDIELLLCLVRDYCERCRHSADARFGDGAIVKLYGENNSLCPTKQTVGSALVDNLRFNSATSKFEARVGTTWVEIPVV